MGDRPPIASVEQVREDLRRLGYLDHGLDRFVLGGAATRSPLRASAAAAARVALLGGAVAGAVTSAGAAALDARLRADPRDVMVLAAYLAVVLGFALGLAAFAAGLVTAWRVRRTGRHPSPRLARNVGLGLTALGLVYLGLWWWSHAAAMSVPVQLVSVAVGILLSAAAGRLGALAAVAVLSAGGALAIVPQQRLSAGHVAAVVAVVAVLIGGGVALAARRARAEALPPDFAVVPTGVAVRVVGIDGLEARMTAQMLARGEMPHLAALLARGARLRLRVEPEQVPAIVWTTIATGRGPEAHGILAPGARRLPGMRTAVALREESAFTRALVSAADVLRLTRAQPASSVLRGAKAFWNVAGEKGLRVGVVNWWATWPADPVPGYVITDRAWLKVEKGGAPERETWPADALGRLAALAPAPEGDRARRIDLFAAGASSLMRADGPPDLEAVYLPGLDITTFQQLAEAPADPAAMEERLEAVRAHYRFLDGRLGALVAEMGPSEVVALVGDPGRLARRGAAEPEGLLVLAGPAIAPGDHGAATERDVAPTVLHLVGLPVSGELQGRALEEALLPAFRARFPVRRVAAYGRRPPARAAESAFDREMLEELRSLGYIQ
jgi:hypothetical protein